MLVEVMSKRTWRPVSFAEDCIGVEAEAAVAALQPGSVLLLENLRFHAGEEKNDPAKLAQREAEYKAKFEAAGIESAPCETIDCLRVAHAAASLECRATRILRLAGEANYMVLGVVTGIHLREDCVIDGRFDLRATGWLSRLGYKDYAITTETFEMERP